MKKVIKYQQERMWRKVKLLRKAKKLKELIIIQLSNILVINGTNRPSSENVFYYTKHVNIRGKTYVFIKNSSNKKWKKYFRLP